MPPRSVASATWRPVLSQALKIIRRSRGLKVAELAGLMVMRLRSYEYFESACAKPNLERIDQFAAVTAADPHGIVATMTIESPRFAWRSAENKLMTAFFLELESFDLEVGDDMRLLDTTDFFTAFGAAFEALSAETKRKAQQRDLYRPPRPGAPPQDQG